MREIQFRAWDLEDKEMYDVEEIIFINIAYIPPIKQVKLWNGDDFIDRVAKMVILMQYTGAKDMNGTEICEGDILNIHGGAVVIESLDRFFWMKYDDQMRIDFSQYAIIGNIHSNPEMI